MRFTSGSGLAQWCKDQMDVRYQQAVVINEGAANEEAPLNEVRNEDDEQVFACDLPLADESAAEDAFTTLSDHNVLGQALMLDEYDAYSVKSWIEHHICRHDEMPPQPCQVMSREKAPDE